MSRRRRKRKRKPKPPAWLRYNSEGDRPSRAHKTGNRGHRLTAIPVESKEIRAKRRENRAPQPVTTSWVEPDPQLKHPDAPATGKQLRYVALLANKMGVETPSVQTRLEAAEAIGRLRGLAIRRGGQDPARQRRRRAAGGR